MFVFGEGEVVGWKSDVGKCVEVLVRMFVFFCEFVFCEDCFDLRFLCVIDFCD